MLPDKDHSSFLTHKLEGGMHPAMMHPRMREAMSQGNSGRLPPAQPLKTQMFMSPDGTTGRLPVQAAKATGPSSVGTLGMIMPIYSIVIVLFFIYAMFKLITRDKEDEELEQMQEKRVPHITSPYPPTAAQRFPFLIPRHAAPKTRRRYDQPSPIYVAASSAFKEFQLIKKIYGLDRQMRKTEKSQFRDPRTTPSSSCCSASSCLASSCRFCHLRSKSHALSTHSVSCSELTRLHSSSVHSPANVPSLHRSLGGKNTGKIRKSSEKELLEETILRRRAFSI